MNSDAVMQNAQYIQVNPQQAENVLDKLPTDEEILYLSELFKIFSDATRIKILYVLLAGGEMCVNDIALMLNMSQSSISHQLRVLKQGRLVKFRRTGKTIFYSLADEHVNTIINQGLVHINE